MKSKEEILLEFGVSDVLLGLIDEQVNDDIYNKMTTSDLQGYCGAKAFDIIKMFKDEVISCKDDADFKRCLKRKGLL